MEPGLNDFVSQIPAYFFIVPLVLGLLYIAVMYIVFRRAAERRRKRRAEQMQMMQMASGTPPGMAMPQPAIYSRAAMPTPQRSLPMPAVPEPDLDLLTSSLLDEAERMVMPDTPPAVSAMLPTPSATPLMMPAQEALPDMPNTMPNTTPAMSASDDLPSDAIEVMRIWRDVSDGSLIIQMGNQRYRSAADIQAPDLLRRFTALVRELSAMISGQPSSTGGMRPLTPLPPTPGALPPLPPRPANSYTTTPEPMKAPGMLNRLMGRPPAPSALPDSPTGIADSVEEYLQTRLVSSPEFARRSIHIRPSLDHGIKIEVDGRYFDGINEVSDDAVRDYLLAMMREWEARQ
jgi:hypothetical protein